jgi:YD repeat-containing protein
MSSWQSHSRRTRVKRGRRHQKFRGEVVRDGIPSSPEWRIREIQRLLLLSRRSRGRPNKEGGTPRSAGRIRHSGDNGGASRPPSAQQQHSHAINNNVTLTITGYGTAKAETTTSSYDGDNELTQVVDATGNTSSFGYDALGEEVSAIYGVGTLAAATTSDSYDCAVPNCDRICSRIKGVWISWLRRRDYRIVVYFGEGFRDGIGDRQRGGADHGHGLVAKEKGPHAWV